MQKTRAAIVLSLTLMWVPVVSGDAPPLESLIPPDASMVLVVDDVDALPQTWAATPVGRLWNDPEVREFFAPLHDRLAIDRWSSVVERETGHSLDRLITMVPGGAALFVPNLSRQLAASTADAEATNPVGQQPTFALIAQLGDNGDSVRALLAEQSEKRRHEQEAADFEITIESYRDVDLHLMHRSNGAEGEAQLTGGWAIVDALLVVSAPSSQLKTVVGAVLDGGTDRTVSSQPAYVLGATTLPNADVMFSLNMAPFRDSIRNAMRDGMKGQAAASMMDPDALYDALGIDVIDGMFAALDFASDATVFDFGLSIADDEGIVEILAYGPGPAPRSGLIPAAAVGFGSATFDAGRAWGAIEEIATAVNPALPAMVAMQLAAMTGQNGVEMNLRRDVLENLTGEIYTVDLLPSKPAAADGTPPQMPQAVVVGLDRSEAFESVVRALITAATQDAELFTTRELNGTTIHAFKTEPAEDGTLPSDLFSWAVPDGYAVLGFGGAEALEAVLSSLRSPRRTVWQSPRVRRALGTLPGAPSAVQYQDLAATGALIFEHLAVVCEMSSDGHGPWCNPESLPSNEAVGRHLGPVVSGVYRTNDDIIVRVRALGATGSR